MYIAQRRQTLKMSDGNQLWKKGQESLRSFWMTPKPDIYCDMNLRTAARGINLDTVTSHSIPCYSKHMGSDSIPSNGDFR